MPFSLHWITKKKKFKKPEPVAVETQVNTIIPEGSEMTPEEYKEMIARAKEGEGDDCLMCGS